MKTAAMVFLFACMAFSQTRRRLADYALILEDPPVAQKIQSRMALRSPEAQAQLQRIQTAQSDVLAELKRRKVRVISANQVLVNAVFINATRETAAALRNIPGVAHVVPSPRLKRDLNTALDLVNVPAAWSAVGGASNAGAGIKIGIIDSGIDQNHPGFQDNSLTPPAGFPKGDRAYTNNKVIVARSYITLDTGNDPNDATRAIDSFPDDYSPRDHIGHGTAVAMIAAGAQNTGPVAAIQGVAPKAFLGNYKVLGSPGINEFASQAAFVQALQDAVTDGMDVVTVSLSEVDRVAVFSPLDIDQQNCGGQCDVFAQAVESAVNGGVVVVASAGNTGNAAPNYPNLLSIHTPGTAPSAITVGATTNAHALFQSVKTGGSAFRALLVDGPRPSGPMSAPLVDVATLGNDGLACSALPAGSLNGKIALVQRGDPCAMSDKIINAQNAGAVGVVIYQISGQETPYSSIGAQNTGIPAMMIGYSDGLALKNQANAQTVTLDPAFTASSATPDVVAPFSSRGPSIGNFGVTPTTVVKPELVAVGANIYTATSKFDPSSDLFNASGYAGVSGTSYAVPIVAGTVAMLKQKNKTWTPAQLKSAVVNTASQGVIDNGAAARVNAVGAGKLNAADALNAGATLEPATISFGPIGPGTLPISRTLKLTNVSAATATFNFQVQQRDTDSRTSVTVTPPSLTLSAGASNTVTVRLVGSQPAPGSYEGFIVISGSGPTLRLPYLYFVGDGVPYNAVPIVSAGFETGPGEEYCCILVQVTDQYGLPVTNLPVLFSVVSGGGQIVSADRATDRVGVAAADVKLGSALGDQYFAVQTGSLSTQFDGYAHPFPAINANGVTDAATLRAGQGMAPGSYITIKGTNLADATQVESTSSLPVSLSGVSVTFDGGGLSLPGHLHFVSPGQINVQIPWEFQGQKSVLMKVDSSYLLSSVYTVPLAAYSPGIFEYVDNGVKSAVATDTSFQVISQANPAKRGQTILIYANGLGPVTNQPASGEPSPSSPPALTTATPTVMIGGVAASQVPYSGLAATLVGAYVLGVVVPPNAPTGNQQITISIGGVTSQTSDIAVQ